MSCNWTIKFYLFNFALEYAIIILDSYAMWQIVLHNLTSDNFNYQEVKISKGLMICYLKKKQE